MMNTWTHLLATTVLALLALIIHSMIRNDGNVKSLDVARYYTMVRERGDISAAKQLVSSEDSWLSSACRASVSVPLPTTNACVEERRALRNRILAAMNCFSYSSQVCSYLRNITAGIIQNRTISGTVTAVGRSLAGTVPNQGSLTYRQLLYNAIEQAPYLFRNSYRAEQSENSYVLRTVLYSFVAWAILANILVHTIDQYHMGWGKRLAMRILVFSLATFVVPFFFLLSGMGSFFTAGLGIWIPGLIVLLYYEAFLDATITRPWCVNPALMRPVVPPDPPSAQDSPLHVLHHLHLHLDPRAHRERRAQQHGRGSHRRTGPGGLAALHADRLVLGGLQGEDVTIHAERN